MRSNTYGKRWFLKFACEKVQCHRHIRAPAKSLMMLTEKCFSPNRTMEVKI
jgi:hypothetical protein